MVLLTKSCEQTENIVEYTQVSDVLGRDVYRI